MTCIVVKRGEFTHYDRLYKAFGDRLPVVWDRRRPTRRPADSHEDSRRVDRRTKPPTSWEALGFVVARDSAS
jgi:hypothetical protein